MKTNPHTCEHTSELSKAGVFRNGQRKPLYNFGFYYMKRFGHICLHLSKRLLTFLYHVVLLESVGSLRSKTNTTLRHAENCHDYVQFVPTLF